MKEVILSAPYGHACANCAQSKCKCIIREAGGPCERCHRINKECVPSKTVRRRNLRKPAVVNSSWLEEKLDGLATLIQAGKQSDTIIPSPQSSNAANKSPNHDTAKHQIESFHSTSFQFKHQPSSTRDEDEPSPAEAEEYLLSFQTCKSKYFPFVYIPSTTNALQLRQERPFIWLSIMAVSSKSTSQRQALGNKIRQTIAHEMVFQSEKNIDLLLGLLAFLGWSHYQRHEKPFLATFTQLAISLVFDLGLNKPIPKETHGTLNLCSKISSPRTMEERRAVLGCFLVSSILSTYLQKTDALRWTSEMDECIQILDTAKECPNDEILVQQVQLQLIIEKLALAKSFNRAMESTRGLVSLDLEQLRPQLQGLKISLLTGLSNTETVHLHLYSAELEMTGLVTFLQTNQLTIQQQGSLYTGLESIKSWFDMFFSIPPVAYVDFPFFVFLQLAHCLSMLYRLTALKDPIWGEYGSFKTADAIFISNRVINNLEQVAILNGLDNSEGPDFDVFSRAAHVVQSFRVEWEAKLGAETPLSPPAEKVNENAFPEDLGVEFSDDWFMDLVLFPSY